MAGFTLRTGRINVGEYLGRPEDDIEAIVRRLTWAFHTIGNCIPVLWGPSPLESAYQDHVSLLGFTDSSDPTLLNDRLLPMRDVNGIGDNYDRIIRLCTFLNNKNKGRTYDFLGDGPLPQMIRTSIFDYWNKLGKPMRELELRETMA